MLPSDDVVRNKAWYRCQHLGSGLYNSKDLNSLPFHHRASFSALSCPWLCLVGELDTDLFCPFLSLCFASVDWLVVVICRAWPPRCASQAGKYHLLPSLGAEMWWRETQLPSPSLPLQQQTYTSCFMGRSPSVLQEGAGKAQSWSALRKNSGITALS